MPRCETLPGRRSGNPAGGGKGSGVTTDAVPGFRKGRRERRGRGRPLGPAQHLTHNGKAAGGAHLGHDQVQKGFHGVRADAHPFRNLLVGKALQDQPQNLFLAPGQAEWRERCRRGRQRRAKPFEEDDGGRSPSAAQRAWEAADAVLIAATAGEEFADGGRSIGEWTRGKQGTDAPGGQAESPVIPRGFLRVEQNAEGLAVRRDGPGAGIDQDRGGFGPWRTSRFCVQRHGPGRAGGNAGVTVRNSCLRSSCGRGHPLFATLHARCEDVAASSQVFSKAARGGLPLQGTPCRKSAGVPSTPSAIPASWFDSDRCLSHRGPARPRHVPLGDAVAPDSRPPSYSCRGEIGSWEKFSRGGRGVKTQGEQ